MYKMEETADHPKHCYPSVKPYGISIFIPILTFGTFPFFVVLLLTGVIYLNEDGKLHQASIH
jgi:hypothetical protein